MKRNLLLFTALFLTAIHLLAFDFEKNGIYFNQFRPKEVQVTSGTIEYSGSVNIPASVENNGVTYSVTCIWSYTFSNCQTLTNVTIPNTVTFIGEGAFSNCPKLTSVSLPNTITRIYDSTFSGCSTLSSISIPNSVSIIDDDAFSYSGLTSVSIPNSVTTIGWNVFYDCLSLKTVNISGTVTSIGYYTFSFCSSLTAINVDVANQNFLSKDGVLFNKTMTNLIICPSGFSTTYMMPNSVREINNLAFADCRKLPSIVLSDNLVRIDDDAFVGCKSLTSITLPESLRLIGYDAFGECTSLTSITIPANVEYIGNCSFISCPNLKSIHVKAPIPLVLDKDYPDTFLGLPTSTCVLYVPAGSKTAYQNAPQWWYFKNILEETTGTGIQTISAIELGISAIGSKALISDLIPGELIQVFTVDGKIVFAEKATTRTIEIQLSKDKVYIIKVGAKCAKIIIK